MNFDEEHYVKLTLMFPGYQNQISTSMRLEFYEGSKLVGVGKVTGGYSIIKKEDAVC